MFIVLDRPLGLAYRFIRLLICVRSGMEALLLPVCCYCGQSRDAVALLLLCIAVSSLPDAHAYYHFLGQQEIVSKDTSASVRSTSLVRSCWLHLHVLVLPMSDNLVELVVIGRHVFVLCCV